MRRVSLPEIHAAASLIAGLSPETRARYLDQLLFQAHCADKYRKKTGRNHPHWGNGTLGALVFANCSSDVKGRQLAECLTEVCQSLLRRDTS